MKRFELQITEELGKVLDAALNGQHRNPAIEDWLWRIKEVRDTAKELGLARVKRRGRGRPPAGMS